MKMLSEEKELRLNLRGGYYPDSIPSQKKILSKLIRSLVKAVREDCAKVAESFHLQCENDQPEATWAVDKIIAAIRAK